MNDKHLKNIKEIVTIRSWIAALVVSGVGLLLVIFGERFWSVLPELGSSLLVGGVLWFAWEFLARRAFAEELLALTRLSSDVAEAGLQQILPTFKSHSLSWPDLFQYSDHLDVFVSYAYTWRNERKALLDQMLARAGTRIRVVLPDTNDPHTVEHLCRAFEYEEQKLIQLVAEAIEFFKHLGETAQGKEARVLVYVAPRNSLISWYLFDDQAVLALHSVRGKEPVPTFVCKAGGFLYDFLKKEYEELVRDGVGRLVGEYKNDAEAVDDRERNY